MRIMRVACVGIGLIGQGWATVFASSGYQVIVQDTNEHLLKTGLEKITSNLTFLEANQLIGEGESDRALKRIKLTTEIDEAVGNADYVQESIPDRYDLKKSVFRKMDAIAAQDTILASSTSGLLMTEIQKTVSKPQRCVLVHPYLPVHLIPCVEIVGGKQTSVDTVDAAEAFMRKIGKSPVRLNYEIPGYIVNRLQAAILREAIDLIHKGVACAEDIDNAFRMSLGIRDPFVGPLLRAHLAGDGIDLFIQKYAKSYENRWKSMACWTSIPPKVKNKLVANIQSMELIRTKTLDEIKQWRDKKLVKIIEAVQSSS